ERGALGRIEQTALFVVADRREFVRRNTEMQRAARGMRHAIGVIRNPARRMRNQSLEPAVDLALGVPQRPLHLYERLRQLRLALHGENAIRDESERLEEGVEFLL